MATKTRVANKTIWALEDIMAEIRRGRRAWSKALERAETRSGDTTLLLALVEIRDVLASVEVLAIDARQDRYQGEGQERVA
jgi:hypothetical protein